MKRKVDIDLDEGSSDFVAAEVAWWDHAEVFISNTERRGSNGSEG